MDDLWAATLTAAVGVIGYLGKVVFDAWRTWQHSQDELLARLLRFSCLLKDSKYVFLKQLELTGRLEGLLPPEEGDHTPRSAGHESLLVSLYDRFSPELKELHGIIRSTTICSMRPLNLAMGKWLDEDVDFRTGRSTNKKRQELASKLNLLACHLLLWNAKYEAFIPNNPKHALVYMADEQDHGLGFPEGLDELVEEVLAVMGSTRFHLQESSLAETKS
jgi:hypothetical protein